MTSLENEVLRISLRSQLLWRKIGVLDCLEPGEDADAWAEGQHVLQVERDERVDVADRRSWDVDHIHWAQLKIVSEIARENVLHIHHLVAAILANHHDPGWVRGLIHSTCFKDRARYGRRVGVNEGALFLDLTADIEFVGSRFLDDEADPGGCGLR